MEGGVSNGTRERRKGGAWEERRYGEGNFKGGTLRRTLAVYIIQP